MPSEVKQVMLGSSTVRFHHYGTTERDILLLRVHGDEYDASDVGRWAAEQFPCEFLDIENDTREIFFDYKHELYAVDPNRIFSTAGITATLTEHCDEIPIRQAVAEVEKLAKLITRTIRKYKLIVALHNNEEFNIKFYAPGGECEGSTKALYINSERHPHDFIITTDEDDFLQLKATEINVVLEHSDHNDQAGSLSEYCLEQSIRYVNIEAKKGRAKTQRQMLQAVMKLPLE